MEGLKGEDGRLGFEGLELMEGGDLKKLDGVVVMGRLMRKKKKMPWPWRWRWRD